MWSVDQNIEEDKNKSTIKETTYSFKNIIWFVSFCILYLASLKSPWASTAMVLWSSILYFKLINFFDSFFVSASRCRTFRSKPLNKLFKNGCKAWTQVNFVGGAPYGQVPLPLVPFRTPKFLQTTSLGSILQETSLRFNLDTFEDLPFLSFSTTSLHTFFFTIEVTILAQFTSHPFICAMYPFMAHDISSLFVTFDMS